MPSPILHFQRRLTRLPEFALPPSIHIRDFRVSPSSEAAPGGASPESASADRDAWLLLRQATFDQQTSATRAWTITDFQREFSSQGKGNPKTLFFAVWHGNHENHSQRATDHVVGSITLTTSKEDPERGSLNWLMVDPRYQRQRIGQTLVFAAEQQAWQQGVRQLSLETLPTWKAATSLYRNLGYRLQHDELSGPPTSTRSPENRK